MSRANALISMHRGPAWDGGSDASSDLAAERWELVDAPWGSGSWLLAIGVDRCRAWAPPGVVLGSAESEPVEWWTTAAWAGQPGDVMATPPQDVQSRTVRQLHETVPADFRPWVIGCTEAQIRVLTRFVRRGHPAGADAKFVCDELAAQLAQARDEIQAAESEPVAENRQPIGADAASKWLEAFAALSDYDFALAVCDVIGRELTAQVKFAGDADSPDYVVECISEGRRILIQIHHELKRPTRDLAERLRRRDMVHHAPFEADEHWVVTSAPFANGLEPLQQPGSGAIPGRVCDAAGPTALFDRHPAAVSRHLKLRVAREARDQPDLAGGLTPYAQTRQADIARDRLRDHGLVCVTGAQGSGKTALAQLLMAEARVDGYLPVYVKCVEDLEDALRTTEPQAILWDDFTPTAPAMELIALAGSLSRSKLIIATASKVQRDVTVAHQQTIVRPFDLAPTGARIEDLYHQLIAVRRQAPRGEPARLSPARERAV